MALHSGGAIIDGAGAMTNGAGSPTGTPLTDPPLISMISEDPVLRWVAGGVGGWVGAEVKW